MVLLVWEDDVVLVLCKRWFHQAGTFIDKIEQFRLDNDVQDKLYCGSIKYHYYVFLKPTVGGT